MGMSVVLVTRTSPMSAVEVRVLADGLLGSAKVVDSGVETHVSLEADTVAKMVHDSLDTSFQEIPAVRRRY